MSGWVSERTNKWMSEYCLMHHRNQLDHVGQTNEWIKENMKKWQQMVI